jgi:DNA topoisomerase VI subunit B
VVTFVANKQVKWTNYKIDPKKDKVGVFVSIVSTKVGCGSRQARSSRLQRDQRLGVQIPFKGTGKEYIGQDIDEIRKSVRCALLQCCKQLKPHLLTRNAHR